jgi:hypothetical protein
MKMRLLFALAALAIGLAVRALALSGNLAEDVKAFDEFNAQDESRGGIHQQRCGRLAALFTEDALLVEPEGVFNVREAIEKALTELFQRWRPTNFMSQADKLNAIGNGAWAVGRWWCTLEARTVPRP